MEITDPVLSQAAQMQYVVADDSAPEEKLFTLLRKVDDLIGVYVKLFLSTSRKEHSRMYSQFEQNSFEEMTVILMANDKLHCCDISYIQQFLISLLKWDTSQGSQYKEHITALLNEAQDYEPVATGSPLPSVRLYSGPHVTVITRFFSVHCVSYEVMMTIKYALMHLLHLSLSTFQYVGWVGMNKGCQITWITHTDKFEHIVNKIMYHPSTVILKVNNDFDIKYPCISFSCTIKNKQFLLDGSPLLCPNLDGKIIHVMHLSMYICTFICNVDMPMFPTWSC